MTWDKMRVTALPVDPAEEAESMDEKTIPVGVDARTFPDHWWSDANWNEFRKATRFAKLIKTIKLDPPPTDETFIRGELDEILKKQASTKLKERRPEIEEEAAGPPAYYDRVMFLDELRRPKSKEVLLASVRWSRAIIMHYKQYWKRPRPSQLEPMIRPVVDCPHHPAYPSGHSTQSHLVALVMGALSGRTDLEQALLHAADRIAENREYAGLHYKSDSDAGAQLAPQLLDAFMKEHEKLIKEARTREW